MNRGERLSGSDIRIASLYKHWVTADAIRESMLLPLRGGEVLPPEAVQAAQNASRILTLPVFYGLLHVVVEGYKELALGDE
jgi:hypothetical protein